MCAYIAPLKIIKAVSCICNRPLITYFLISPEFIVLSF